MLHIFIDADACPVKAEVYRVAKRCNLAVTLVANSAMRVPDEQGVVLKVVGGNLDAADDWIVEHAKANDILITTDILLASRCIKEEICVISPTGRLFTEDNIVDAVAARELMAHLREAGEITGGPPPLKKRDRSLFLQELDKAIQRIRREVADDMEK